MLYFFLVVIVLAQSGDLEGVDLWFFIADMDEESDDE
jgi:hypothetical protein